MVLALSKGTRASPVNDLEVKWAEKSVQVKHLMLYIEALLI